MPLPYPSQLTIPGFSPGDAAVSPRLSAALSNQAWAELCLLNDTRMKELRAWIQSRRALLRAARPSAQERSPDA